MNNPTVVNQELLEKTMTTSDFVSGGALNATQQNRLVVFVRKYANLLGIVRFVRMMQASMDIDKLHLGEPITEGATENVSSANYGKAKLNKVSLTASKVRSQWNLTTETLQQSIEGNNFEDTMFEAAVARIAMDLEMLGIRGDTTVGAATAVTRLLSVLDGWLKLADGGHVVDAGGASIEKGIFALAWRRMPKHFRNDPGLRWLVSDTITNDYQDYLSDRSTGVGDTNLVQGTMGPLGIPIHKVPLIPDDLSVSAGGASAAEVLATNHGPYVITTGTNDLFKVDIDNVGAVTVTLSSGTYQASEIAKQIRDALVTGGYTAAQVANIQGTPDGLLSVKSSTTGITSEVDIQASATNAYTIIGLTVAVTAGSASGSVYEGSSLVLVNPKNLIFGMVDGTRVFSEYNKSVDRIETVVYNQVAVEVEELDAIVKVKNVRLRELF